MPAHTPEQDYVNHILAYHDRFCGGGGICEGHARVGRLIAAAPALLEALERSADWMTALIREHTLIPGDKTDEAWLGHALNARDKARAAIAQAKGETHA